MLKGYKESLEKAIPDNWEIGVLSDVSEIKFSNVDKITSSDEAPISLCNYLDVYNNEYIDDRIEFMPATATHKEIKKFALKKGDVIITKDSETPDDIAKPAVVVQDLTNVLCGYHLALIRPDSQRVDSVFLGKMLSSKIFNHQFERLAQGLTRFGLEVSSIKNALIAIPPPQEQRKIAEILSTIDDTIEKTDAIIKETQQLKKGLMQKLFTEGIGHTRFKETKIGRIPEEWELRPAEKVCIRVTDGTHDTPKPVDEGYFLVTSKNLKNGNLAFEDCYRISEQDFHEVNMRSKVDQYDVIYGMIGTIGNPVMITQECVDFAIKNVGLFKTGGDKQLGTWLVHYLCSKKSLDFMERHKNGTSQNFVPLGLLREFPIPMPQDEEIKRINGALSEFDAKTEKEQAFKAELEQLKKGLMQVLLTGKVRVKV